MSRIPIANPLHKKCIDNVMRRLGFIYQQNKSLELARLVVKLYKNEFKHIGECYETNYHSS